MADPNYEAFDDCGCGDEAAVYYLNRHATPITSTYQNGPFTLSYTAIIPLQTGQVLTLVMDTVDIYYFQGTYYGFQQFGDQFVTVAAGGQAISGALRRVRVGGLFGIIPYHVEQQMTYNGPTGLIPIRVTLINCETHVYYGGKTSAPDSFFQIGGTPEPSDWNIYALHVSGGGGCV